MKEHICNKIQDREVGAQKDKDKMSNSGSNQNQKTSPAVFFLAALFFLLIGLISLPQDLKAQTFKNVYEFTLPPQTFIDYPTLFGDADETTEAYLVYSNRETKFRVYFDSRSSIKGWWRGSNAVIHITSPYTQTLPATTNMNDKWGLIITSKDVDPFTPWLDVALSVDPEYEHTWIRATVSLDIVYPMSDGASFVNQEEHFSREIQLFVTDDNDPEIQVARKSWTHEQSWWEPWVLQLIAWPPALVLLVVGLFALFRKNR